MSLVLQNCTACPSGTIAEIGRICPSDLLDGRFHAIAISACGTPFTCLTDIQDICDRLSREPNYPALGYDGNPHPLAGQPNPLNSTLTIIRNIEGEIGDPDVEEEEFSLSCFPETIFGDASFTANINFPYTFEQQELLKQICQGGYEDVVFINREGLGFRVSSSVASVRATNNTLLNDKYMQTSIEVQWTQACGVLDWEQVAQPLYLDCE